MLSILFPHSFMNHIRPRFLCDLLPPPSSSKPHSNHKAQQEPDRRSQYTRHYAFKGRGRKEFLRSDMKDQVDELVFTRAGAGVGRSLHV